jgi:hypothetical protein
VGATWLATEVNVTRTSTRVKEIHQRQSLHCVQTAVVQRTVQMHLCTILRYEQGEVLGSNRFPHTPEACHRNDLFAAPWLLWPCTLGNKQLQPGRVVFLDKTQ